MGRDTLFAYEKWALLQILKKKKNDGRSVNNWNVLGFAKEMLKLHLADSEWFRIEKDQNLESNILTFIKEKLKNI